MPILFGSELRRRRLAAGLSLADLAKTVHYSKSHLSKVETGAKPAGPDLARRCDAVLKADGALLTLVPVRPTPGPTPMAGYDESHSVWRLQLDLDGRGEYTAVPRRGVLVAGALSMFGWTTLGCGTWRRGGHRDYDAFRAMFDVIRGMGQHMVPAMLMPVLICATDALRRLAAAASPATRDPFWLLAARFAEYTGWLAQESGEDGHALHWTDQAVKYATAGGDQRMGAYALVRRAEIAMYQTRAQETVALAQQAQRLDCGNRVRALAAQREAQGHAIAGQARECDRALDRAERWLSESDPDGPLPALGTSNVRDLTGLTAGWCLYDLGKPRQAGELLRTQLNQTPSGAYRMKARIGARYALALVGDGEVEQACAEIPHLLDWYFDVDSATVRSDLDRLLRALNRFSKAPYVRQVTPDLTAALSCR